jgi:hypothetical protein
MEYQDLDTKQIVVRVWKFGEGGSKGQEERESSLVSSSGGK